MKWSLWRDVRRAPSRGLEVEGSQRKIKVVGREVGNNFEEVQINNFDFFLPLKNLGIVGMQSWLYQFRCTV